MCKHLVSQVARAIQQTPGLDGPAFPSRRERTDLSFEGASPPLYLSGEGETGGRNEVANGQENHEVGIHYDVAHRGVTAPLRELRNAAGLCHFGCLPLPAESAHDGSPRSSACCGFVSLCAPSG